MNLTRVALGFVALFGLLEHLDAQQSKIPSLTFPDGQKITFKRFTEGRPREVNPRSPSIFFDHPNIFDASSASPKLEGWSSKYVLVFDIKGDLDLHGWRVAAMDDDGYSCELQPSLSKGQNVLWFQDPLPVGSRDITFKFKQESVSKKEKVATPIEIVIPNPFFALPSIIKTQRLPQTQSCFGAEVTLTEVTRIKSPGPHGAPLVVKYSVKKGTAPWFGLECAKIVIEDAFGLTYEVRDWGSYNTVSGANLSCSRAVPWRASLAWKMQLHFKRRAIQDSFSPDECYQLKHLARTDTKSVRVSIAVPDGGELEAQLVDGHVLKVSFPASWDEQTSLLFLKLTDDQGRMVLAPSYDNDNEVIEWPDVGSKGRVRQMYSFNLDLKPDAKWIDATLAIETPRMVEFLVKPNFVD